MRVVVFGATGNVGSRVVAALAADPGVRSIVGVARRPCAVELDKVEWVRADIATSSLEPIIDGADSVIHLAWMIQPVRDEELLHRTNIDGTDRLVRAASACRVTSFVYASSVGAYSRGEGATPRGEEWPTDGIVESLYSRQKAGAEHLLDRIELEHPQMRIVRLRMALVFQRLAASEIARYFLGPLAPTRMIGRRRVPLVPGGDHVRFQVVHAADAADAFVAALHRDVRGAFNHAADPLITAPLLAEALRARSIELSPRLLRGAAAATFALHLQPTSPGWVDLALGAPVMDTTAALERLGWLPKRDAVSTLSELLDGFAAGAGTTTVPLRPRTHLEAFPSVMG